MVTSNACVKLYLFQRDNCMTFVTFGLAFASISLELVRDKNNWIFFGARFSKRSASIFSVVCCTVRLAVVRNFRKDFAGLLSLDYLLILIFIIPGLSLVPVIKVLFVEAILIEPGNGIEIVLELVTYHYISFRKFCRLTSLFNFETVLA